MKLRTEMAKWSDGNMYPSVHGEREVYGMLEHDAACAHALLLAMDEFSAWPQVIGVRKRASELMREWGFDSGEVE